jgi:hypothetical protein
MITTDEIAERIMAADTDAALRESGLLFHGTAEPFDDDLRPSPFDEVLWFTDNPLLAQAYIPECGLVKIVSRPESWHLDARVKPGKNSFWSEFANVAMGRSLPDAEYDRFGDAISWRATTEWPTYAEAMTELCRLGYDLSSGSAAVKTSSRSGETEFVRADWLEPGRVYVTASDGLNLLDLSMGEGDLQDPMHLRLNLFRAAEKRGFSGIKIDDFAQSADCGNVGHKAIGLFASAVRRPYLVYPAHHRMMDGVRSLLTEDFRAFWETLAERASSRPSSP